MIITIIRDRGKLSNSSLFRRKRRMKAMVPEVKKSRRVRRQDELKRRVTWAFSPVSRRKESGKVYKRQKPRTEE
jgi:hypothetical protein